MRRLVMLTCLLLSSLVLAPLALAEQPPQYFVDETKLPFEALPGATALWRRLQLDYISLKNYFRK